MKKPLWIIGIAGCMVAALFARPAAAQGRLPVALEVTSGWSGFLDESWIDHAIIGGAARIYLTPRLSIGPECVYMIGPGHDRDLFVMGNVTFDAYRQSGSGARRVSPYFLVTGGYYLHRNRVGPFSFTSHEGGFTTGGGVRAFVTDRIYVAPEMRLGWEPHLRATVTVGFTLP